MIVFQKTGVIKIENTYHYVEISTKTDPPIVTEGSPYPVAKPYVEVIFLEEEPRRTEKFYGNLIQKEDGFYVPGGYKLEEENQQVARYIGKDSIYVDDEGEQIYGTALIQASSHTIKLIVNGGILVGGLLRKVTFQNVEIHENSRKQGDIEETGDYLFHMNQKLVTATYQKEWCGCQANELRTYVMGIKITDPNADLARALSAQTE